MALLVAVLGGIVLADGDRHGGTAFGAPLGVALGRSVWRWFADRLGTPAASAETPLLWLDVAALATVVLANLVAAVLGRSAASTRPAVVLRDEEAPAPDFERPPAAAELLRAPSCAPLTARLERSPRTDPSIISATCVRTRRGSVQCSPSPR